MWWLINNLINKYNVNNGRSIRIMLYVQEKSVVSSFFMIFSLHQECASWNFINHYLMLIWLSTKCESLKETIFIYGDRVNEKKNKKNRSSKWYVDKTEEMNTNLKNHKVSCVRQFMFRLFIGYWPFTLLSNLKTCG